ncbi:MAG: ATP-dependent DNA helicase [Acidiferrobacteraceae bacterium]
MIWDPHAMMAQRAEADAEAKADAGTFGNASLLDQGGPFARGAPGFVARSTQVEMSARIEQAILQDEHLLCESGTGTGKTLAYLVPVLMLGRKTIISTGTRALQEQLFRKDLPLAKAILQSPVRAVLLKGRSNYLCWERLESLSIQREVRTSNLAAVRAWALATRTGDLSEAPGLAEEAGLWRSLTVSADECLGVSCPSYGRCHVQRARHEAQEADVVIANHHLFFADLALGEDGFGRLLPEAETLIFDEAHQLPALASELFGESVTAGQLLDLVRDLRRASREENLVIEDLTPRLHDLDVAVTRFADSLSKGVRCLLVSLRQTPPAWALLCALDQALAALLAPFERTGTCGERSMRAVRRGRQLLGRLQRIIEGEHGEWIAWVESQPRGFTLRLTPGTVGPEFRRQIERDGCRRDGAWIFLSATLCVRNSFSHFMRMLSIEDASTARWESPFDYARQALLYLPPGLPDPGGADYWDRMIEAIVPVLELSKGRAFVLFTTHRGLAYVRDRLRPLLPFPIFAQGDASRSQLIEGFRSSGNGVLLGTGSFWEGVDVAGPALSCVIIDKLPFAPPDDPVEQARMRQIKEQGGSSFHEHQLPQAVVALKQGVGRLIRTASDRGVLVLCDPRLRTRGYGRAFLDSLPAMSHSRELGDVARFFAAREGSAA